MLFSHTLGDLGSLEVHYYGARDLHKEWDIFKAVGTNVLSLVDVDCPISGMFWLYAASGLLIPARQTRPHREIRAKDGANRRFLRSAAIGS